MQYTLAFITLLFYGIATAQAPTRSQTLPADTALPPVTITAFKLFNDNLPVDSLLKLNKIELQNDRNSFSISFALPANFERDSLLYCYKLEGAEQDWIKTTKPQTVNYTLVPPGSYTFLVKVQNKAGSVSTAVTSLPVLIRLPFWLSWWFILLCCLTFAAIIYYLHRLSVNRILAIEALRQKVARDLHDDMGSTLSTINILSLMAKTKLSEDPVKTNEFLTKISDNSSRMLEAMDDIVWSINPANDSMEKTVARMRSFATEVLEAKDIALDFHVDSSIQDIQLNMEQRRDFFLIYKEAVNNSAKYAHCKNVNITIHFAQQVVTLKIEDDGVGFDVEQADAGNGLNNMRKRAEALGGSVSIQSQPGRGTIIYLQLTIT